LERDAQRIIPNASSVALVAYRIGLDAQGWQCRGIYDELRQRHDLQRPAAVGPVVGAGPFGPEGEQHA
jgi:precorrin-6B methylase 1